MQDTETYLVAIPTSDVSVIPLGNEESFNSFKAGNDIAEFYLKDTLKPKIIAANPPFEPNQMKQFKSKLSELEGDYYSPELTTTYHLEIKNNKLVMLHRKLSDVEPTAS